MATLAGVTGLTNLITVSPAIPADELKSTIESALKRDLGTLARRIIVEVANDRVKLWGCVAAGAEREASEGAVWSVPGVHEVPNHITVETSVAAAAAT